MTECNCCSKPVERFAWCDECSPGIAYEGSTETGLRFTCPVHRKSIEIQIVFEIGETS